MSHKKSLDIGPGTRPAKGTTHSLEYPAGFEFEYGEALTPKVRRKAWKPRRLATISTTFGNASQGLPYASQSFDRVTANYVLGNAVDLDDLPATTNEIMRVLKSGGTFSFKVYTDDDVDVIKAIRHAKGVVTRTSVIERDEEGVLDRTIRGYKP